MCLRGNISSCHRASMADRNIEKRYSMEGWFHKKRGEKKQQTNRTENKGQSISVLGMMNPT